MAEEGTRFESIRNSKHVTAAADAVKKNSGHPLILVLASLVCMIAASVICDVLCISEVAYAVAGATISLVAILFYIVYEAQVGMSDFVELLYFTFLFVWWGIYAGFTTFRLPFVAVSNGYFGAWLGFFSSTAMLMAKVKTGDTFLRESAQILGTKMALVFVFSLVVALAGFAALGQGDLPVVAIVAGLLSAFFIIAKVLFKLEEQAAAIVLSLWWLVFTSVLTFGLFLVAGNGFFASWICLIGSVMMVNQDWSADS